MSIPEEKQRFVGDGTAWPTRTATFLAQEGGDGFMGARNMTVERYEEIRRRLEEGRRVREIARALGCSRRTVREVRDGLRGSPAAGAPARARG
jgi:DNA-binding NarL/FixJ family response regulator